MAAVEHLLANRVRVQLVLREWLTWGSMVGLSPVPAVSYCFCRSREALDGVAG
jgi:hypothetical protein